MLIGGVLGKDWAAQNTGVLSELLYSWIGEQSIASVVFSTILVFLQAILINVAVNDHKLNSSINMFPGLFYILVSSTIFQSLQLTPLLMANTFLLLALAALWNTYKKNNCADKIFNVGLWIGVASLFYPVYSFFMVMAFAGLSILRAFRLQERLMILAGYLVPVFLGFTISFWNDQEAAFLQTQFTQAYQFLSLPASLDFDTILILAGAGVTLLILVLGQNNFMLRKTIDARKRIDVLYWMLFCGGLSLLFLKIWAIDHLMILSLPVGILLSFAFTRLSNKWAEAVHFILVLGLLLIHYQSVLS